MSENVSTPDEPTLTERVNSNASYIRCALHTGDLLDADELACIANTLEAARDGLSKDEAERIAQKFHDGVKDLAFYDPDDATGTDSGDTADHLIAVVRGMVNRQAEDCAEKVNERRTIWHRAGCHCTCGA